MRCGNCPLASALLTTWSTMINYVYVTGLKVTFPARKYCIKSVVDVTVRFHALWHVKFSAPFQYWMKYPHLYSMKFHVLLHLWYQMKCLYCIYTIATIPNFCYWMKCLYFIHCKISNFTILEVIDAMFIFYTASYTAYSIK